MLQAERLDHRRKRGRLLLPARIVEEEAREGRAPVFEDAHQRPSREVSRHAIFRHPGQPCPVKSSLDHQIQVIEEERPADRDGQRLIAFVEFPPVPALASVAKADAPMLQHVSRDRRLRVRFEVRRRGDDRRA